ncbi:MAG: prolyl oligopeptidase family serine peptidase [Flavobacteriales bacterium]|nr:prolyl oligopeptidase family serine peptidase [Flavobacteriales bacterium]
MTTMLDEGIPLYHWRFDGVGDPKEKDAYDRMLSYLLPGDSVKDADYPAILVTTGFHDSQCSMGTCEMGRSIAREPSARRRGPHTNMDAGHGGPPGRASRRTLKGQLNYAFSASAGRFENE